MAKTQNASCEKTFLDNPSTFIDDTAGDVMRPEEVVVNVALDVGTRFVKIGDAEFYSCLVQRLWISRAKETLTAVDCRSSRKVAIRMRVHFVKNWTRRLIPALKSFLIACTSMENSYQDEITVL